MNNHNESAQHENRNHEPDHEHLHSEGGFDAETAHWYADNYGDHRSNHLTVELAGIKPDDIVLDIGCGTGTAVREAAKLALKGKLIGCDPSQTMIEIAEEQTVNDQNRERIEFMAAGAENLPAEDSSIDVVLAVNSLHHWSDVDLGLAEVKRVLKPGGRFCMGDEVTEDGKCGHGDGPLTDPSNVTGILERAGFICASFSQHKNSEVEIYKITCLRPTIL
ncbi:MAG: methyltransferase domain-containing protein [FCB group bacterium]|nr:methyltransferase domain-containing protein [FCB group bacterium]